MRRKYRAAIVGCGNIGVFYSKPGQADGIITHAHAYKNEPRIEIGAFVDTDFGKAKKAAGIWGGRAYDDIHEMFRNEDIDIVSICVPDELHKDVLRICLRYKPKAVFCEKPITTDFASAREIVKKYKRARILLGVNYFRRWSSSMIDLKKAVSEGRHGKVINVIGIYSKGILHNGSHLIDILRYLFGEVKKIIPLSGRVDWKRGDPTIDAFLEFGRGQMAHIIGADERKYSIFDLDILFEKARFSFRDFGREMVIYKRKTLPGLKAYRELDNGRTIKTQVSRAMFKAVTNLINALEGTEELRCPGHEALLTQNTCLAALDFYKRSL